MQVPPFEHVKGVSHLGEVVVVDGTVLKELVVLVRTVLEEAVLVLRTVLKEAVVPIWTQFSLSLHLGTQLLVS